MGLPDLEYDFYGAIIHQAKFGPRREVTLTMELWPTASNGQRKRVWSPGDGKKITVRFGGIHNYPEIDGFFSGWEKQIDKWNSLHYLAYAKEKSSKPGNLYFTMEFDRSGDRVMVHCQSITIREIEDSTQM